ncbi:MAG TPA: N-formylglutamate deformylase [Novimethylophilus sp.]|jgi:N-formylglutamate deformylase|uniref:N-formylglutamate deformylase n=1 Tax=Novimethylophilus sp. TaxID=2137426 RepID=UPI002F41E26C
MSAKIPVFKLRQGGSPLLVSMPHVGTHLPSWLTPRLTPEALALADTDWCLEALYDFLDELDATLVVATHSRYVVDLNRPPDDASLYPGHSTTGLCPIDTFDARPVYVSGSEPGFPEMRRRIATYWRPYHTTLEAELARLKALHGSALLWDAHSIRSKVPRFFEGELPNFNIGTADHQACAPELAERLAAVVRNHGAYSWVMNGRFKGGYITRHYGQPGRGVHAVQLEMAMRTYMLEAPPFGFDEVLASPVRPVLRAMMEAMLVWQQSQQPQ